MVHAFLAETVYHRMMSIRELIPAASLLLLTACGARDLSGSENAAREDAGDAGYVVDAAGPAFSDFGCSQLLEGEIYSWYYYARALSPSASNGTDEVCAGVQPNLHCDPCTLDPSQPWAQCSEPIPLGVQPGGYMSLSYDMRDRTVYVLSSDRGLVPLCVAH